MMEVARPIDWVVAVLTNAILGVTRTCVTWALYKLG